MSNPEFTLKPTPVTKDLNLIKAILIFGGLLMFVLIAILGYFFYADRNNDSDRRAQDADDKIEARIAATRLYNRDQTLRREFQSNNVLTLIALGNERDPESVAASPEFAKYKEFLVVSFPYRNTSAACVNALYDDEVPDCPPALTEAGDP